MKKILKYSFLGLALAVGANTAAYADRWHHDRDHDRDRAEPRTAAEVDPSLAITGFSLVAGTLTVMRARRRN